jgi:cob(I)alamin adenosyltransferase
VKPRDLTPEIPQSKEKNMSISTRRGDSGQTDLVGGVRTSKASLRVESYGTIDELISQLGFVRSIAPDAGHRDLVKETERTLFLVCALLATPPDFGRQRPEIDAEAVDAVDRHIRELESSGLPRSDWTVAGDHPAAAAMDVARTVCRRAERHTVRLAESGEFVDPNVLRYLNRLSDMFWLVARQMEFRARVDGRLRTGDHPGKPWSRAW